MTAPSRAPSTSGRLALGAGVALLVLAALAWVLHARSADDGHHSWDRGSAPATVRLNAGQVYHLSTRDGISAATPSGGRTGSATFTCTYASEGQPDRPLSVSPVPVDARVLHRVATFVAPVSEPMAITCASLGVVFVDDARSADFDLAGLWVVVSVGLGFAGGLLLMSGLAALATSPRESSFGAPGQGEMVHE